MIADTKVKEKKVCGTWRDEDAESERKSYVGAKDKMMRSDDDRISCTNVFGAN